MASELETELQCAVCLDFYVNPYTLPCQHNFCMQCIGALHELVPNPETAIVCPTCRREFVTDTIHSFPRNFVLANIIAKYTDNNNKMAACTDTRLCDLCEGGNKQRAVKSCKQCGVSYCKGCFETYHPMRGPLAKHLVQTPVEAAASAMRPTCPEHDSKDLDMFCVPCMKPICYLCDRIGGHHEHKVCDIKTASAQRKANIGERILKLKQKKKHTDAFIKQLEEGSKMCKKNHSLAENEVSTHFKLLHSTIALAEQTMKMQLTHRKDRKMQALSTELKQTSKASSDIDRTTSTAQEILKEKDPVSFLLRASSLERSLQASEKCKTKSILPDDLRFPYLWNYSTCLQASKDLLCHNLNLVLPVFADACKSEQSTAIKNKLIYDAGAAKYPARLGGQVYTLSNTQVQLGGAWSETKAEQGNRYECVSVLSAPLTQGHNYIEFFINSEEHNQKTPASQAMHQLMHGRVTPTKCVQVSHTEAAFVLYYSPTASINVADCRKGISTDVCHIFTFDLSQVGNCSSVLCRLLIRLDNPCGPGVLAALPSNNDWRVPNRSNEGADIYPIPKFQQVQKSGVNPSYVYNPFVKSVGSAYNTTIQYPPQGNNLLPQTFYNGWKQERPFSATQTPLRTSVKLAEASSHIYLGFCLNTPGASIEVVENPVSWSDAVKLVF